MKYAHFFFAATALAFFAHPACAQDANNRSLQSAETIRAAPCPADTTKPETMIDPEIIICPDTSVTAEMTVIVPPDTVDPEMVHYPHPTITGVKKLKSFPPKKRGEENEKDK